MDSKGEKRLVAYVIFDKSSYSINDTNDIKDELRNHLPTFMIPEFVVGVKSFPMTPNGKIDRNALSFPNEINVTSVQNNEPTNEKEKILLDIWKKVIGNSDISIDDNYFHRGGNSIQATRLFAAIEKEFGLRLPMAMLYEAPTIQLQAKYIEKASDSITWKTLVPLRLKGKRPPLFIAHGAGGNILLYRDLVKYLGDDQPVYGIQSIGLGGKLEPLTSIEQMGELYAEEIATIYPDGPYLLAGYCMGGLIAYEIACHLSQKGKDVKLVALLDTAAYWKDFNHMEKVIVVYENTVFHVKNIMKSDFPGKYKFLHDRTIEALSRIKLKINILLKRMTHQTDLTAYTMLNEIKLKNDNAAREYKPRAAYNGKITLFKPFINFSYIKSDTMGWDKVIKSGLDIVNLSCYPKGILVEPFVKELAEKMNTCIDKVINQSEDYRIKNKSEQEENAFV
jgi:thioesterase domain-containing protein/acyl carrier protein